MGQIISITEAEARGQRGIRESWWRGKQDKRVKVDGQMAQQKFGVDSCATICLNVRPSMSISANGFEDGVEILRRQLLAYKEHKCGGCGGSKNAGKKITCFSVVQRVKEHRNCYMNHSIVTHIQYNNPS